MTNNNKKKILNNKINNNNDDKNSDGFASQVNEEIEDKSNQNEDDIKDLRNNAKNLSIGNDKENK